MFFSHVNNICTKSIQTSSRYLQFNVALRERRQHLATRMVVRVFHVKNDLSDYTVFSWATSDPPEHIFTRPPASGSIFISLHQLLKALTLAKWSSRFYVQLLYHVYMNNNKVEKLFDWYSLYFARWVARASSSSVSRRSSCYPASEI